MGVIGQELRRQDVVIDAGFCPFFVETADVVQRPFPRMGRLAVASRFRPGNAAEDDDIQEAVAHEAVRPVDTADVFTGGIEAGYLRFTLGADTDAAILVMQGRIDQDGLLADIDAKFSYMWIMAGRRFSMVPSPLMRSTMGVSSQTAGPWRA